MFELPDAKRVRRSELQRHSSSRSASPSTAHGGRGSVDSSEAHNAGAEAAHAALASFFSSRYEEVPHEQAQPSDATSTSASFRNPGKLKTTIPKPVLAAAADGKKRSKRRDSGSRSPSASVSSAAPSEPKEVTEDGDDAASSEDPPTYSFRLFDDSSPNLAQTGRDTGAQTAEGRVSAATSSSDHKHHSSSTAASTTKHVQQITLEPLFDPLGPSPRLSNAGGLVGARRRPKDYYFAAPWSAEQRTATAQLCLKSTDLVREFARRWPGCAVSWRVRKIRVGRKGRTKLAQWAVGVGPGIEAEPDTQTTPKNGKRAASGGNGKAKPAQIQGVVGVLLGPDGSELKAAGAGDGLGPSAGQRQRPRPRPGKKRRLIERKRAQAEAERQRLAARSDEQKAQDRTRKNREKKVRRKMKQQQQQHPQQDGELEKHGDEQE